jgi:hypothetical protein
MGSRAAVFGSLIKPAPPTIPCTTHFHDKIADPLLTEAERVLDDATALDATVDVLNTHASAGNAPIRGFLHAREGPAQRLLDRHDHLDLVVCEREETEILYS